MVYVIIVPLNKRNGDKYECGNSTVNSLFNVVGKLFGRVLTERIRAGTNCAIGEEQCGLRKGRGCMDPVICCETGE